MRLGHEWLMNDTKQSLPPDIPNFWKVAPFLLVLLLVSLWSSTSNLNAPPRHTINYSQFAEQLDAGNIKSVTIRKEALSGELRNETSLPLQEGGKPAQVKYFKTTLPTFQGEGLLTLLQEKKVTISIESAEHGAVWQTVLALLPWLLIIGVWVVILRRNQQIQGGPGGLFTFGASKDSGGRC